MKKSLKIFLAAVLIVVAGVAAFAIYTYEQPSTTNTMKGTHNILLLCDDPTEDNGTQGIGSVDMAFAINVVNGSINNVTPIYPGGMRHPTAAEPSVLGAGKLLLHDSLYGVSTEKGAQRAQEIVEYNTGIKTDAVIMMTPTAVDAFINVIGPIYVDGYGYVSNNSIEFLRDEQNPGNMTRGAAVESIMNPIFNATKDKSKYLALAKVALMEYSDGNIRVVPSDLVSQFAVANGLKLIS